MAVVQLALIAAMLAAAASQLYVSVDGSDSNPGTADLPYLTIARAQEQVRVLKQAGLTAPLYVYLNGTFFVTSTGGVLVGPADSGTAEAPIIYTTNPASSEQATISGGVVITSQWTQNASSPGLWYTMLPASTAPFMQMWADGERQFIAQTETFVFNTAPTDQSILLFVSP